MQRIGDSARKIAWKDNDVAPEGERGPRHTQEPRARPQCFPEGPRLSQAACAAARSQAYLPSLVSNTTVVTSPMVSFLCEFSTLNMKPFVLLVQLAYYALTCSPKPREQITRFQNLNKSV